MNILLTKEQKLLIENLSVIIEEDGIKYYFLNKVFIENDDKFMLSIKEINFPKKFKDDNCNIR